MSIYTFNNYCKNHRLNFFSQMTVTEIPRLNSTDSLAISHGLFGLSDQTVIIDDAPLCWLINSKANTYGDEQNSPG